MNRELLDVNSNIFDGFRRQLSGMLNKTVEEMNRKNVDEADFSVKMKIKLYAVTQSCENGFDVVTAPVISHKIESRMQIKENCAGNITTGDHQLVFDDELGKYVLMSIVDQTNMFENEVEKDD